MFIKRIELENFRSHKHLDIELKDLNVVIGENGAGKSTILEAICYCLFGTVASGAKKADLIRYGQKTGYVKLSMDNGYTIVKDFSNGIKLLDENGKIVSEKVNEVESYFSIDKDVFMNILYASQNNIYSYFLKFNAKEKDFLDNVFNLDKLTTNIAVALDQTRTAINMEIKDLQTKASQLSYLKTSIKGLLQTCQMESVSQLEQNVDVAHQQLLEFQKQQNLFSVRENLVRSIERAKGMLNKYEHDVSSYTERIAHTDESIKALYDELDQYFIQLEQELKVSIDRNNLDSLFEMFQRNTNLTTHLDHIQMLAKKGIEAQDSNSNKYFEAIYSAIETIRILDQYRAYYQNIKDKLLSMRRNIENAVNAGISDSNNLELLKESISDTSKEIASMEDQLKSIQIVDDVQQFTNMLSAQQFVYTKLETTLKNVHVFERELAKIDDAEANNSNIELQIEHLQSLLQSLDRINPIFSRDGFVSYIRKSLLKELGLSLDDSLEKFGFVNLTPVTIDDNGRLLFHERPLLSMSGGEKSIIAIILRILYAKLLAPSSKLHVLLLDEPTDSLDSVRVGYLRQLLTRISSTMGYQIIVITHDENMIPENAHTINLNSVFMDPVA